MAGFCRRYKVTSIRLGCGIMVPHHCSPGSAFAQPRLSSNTSSFAFDAILNSPLNPRIEVTVVKGLPASK